MLIFFGGVTVILLITGALFFVFGEPQPAASAPKLLPASERADLILIEKSARLMSLSRKGQVLSHYRIHLGFSPTGNKMQQGDGKTPEGSYRIDRRNAHSRFHLSLGLDYPTKAQRQSARKQGVDPGGDIFIHGQPNKLKDLHLPPLPFDWTDGCIAVSNKEIEEIFAHVATGTQVIIRP